MKFRIETYWYLGSIKNYLHFRPIMITYWHFDSIERTDIYVQKWHLIDIFIKSSQHDHINNYFSDKFVFLCHIDYFINNDEQKLTIKYIYCTFYTSRTKFYIFIFQVNDQVTINLFIIKKFNIKMCMIIMINKKSSYVKELWFSRFIIIMNDNLWTWTNFLA